MFTRSGISQASKGAIKGLIIMRLRVKGTCVITVIFQVLLISFSSKLCDHLQTKYQQYHVQIQRGDRVSGPPPPTKNHKNIGFSSNTGPDPLKNHCYRASIQCWAIIRTLAERRKKRKKEKRRQSLTPYDKTFWICAWWLSLFLWKQILKCNCLRKIMPLFCITRLRLRNV